MSTTITTPATPKKKFRLGRAVGILAVPVALIVGVSIGSSGSEATTTPAAPPDPVIKTETVTVEKTPAACIKAMDLADKANEYSGEGFTYAGDALVAASSFDLDALDQANQDLADLKPKLQGNLMDYAAASAQCRNAGK